MTAVSRFSTAVHTMDLLNTMAQVGSLLAAVAAFGALVYAYQAVQGTKLQAYLATTQMLSLDPEARRDRDRLMALDRATWSTWTADEMDAARRCCARLNVAAVLNRKKMLPKKLLLEQYYVVYARAWYRADAWLSDQRLSTPKLYADFVELGKAAAAQCDKEEVKYR